MYQFLVHSPTGRHLGCFQSSLLQIKTGCQTTLSMIVPRYPPRQHEQFSSTLEACSMVRYINFWQSDVWQIVSHYCFFIIPTIILICIPRLLVRLIIFSCYLFIIWIYSLRTTSVLFSISYFTYYIYQSFLLHCAFHALFKKSFPNLQGLT